MAGRRIPHPLRELKKISFPTRLVFFDTEAYEKDIDNETKQQTLRLLTACYVRRDKGTESWLQTTDDKEFYNWILTKLKTKSPLYVFAHNIWYDLKVSRLIDNLMNDGWKLSDVFDNSGNGLVLILKKDDYKIVCIDTVNYFNVPLKKLGKSIGLEKLDTDVFTEDIEELKRYNKRDVEIIKKAMLELFEFLQREELCGFGYTIASLSLKAFRTKFMKHRIFIHANPEVDKLELEAYYGGRVECFRIGKIPEKLYKLDINSMYPFVMRNQRYPTDLVGYYEKFTVKGLETRIKRGYLAIAEVVIETDEPAYPYRTKDKLLFPVGRFKTVLSTPELKYALERGHIKEVRRVAFYKGDFIFRDYIDYFYNKRLEAKAEGNETYAYFYKIFMNSLYGKFAQKIRRKIYSVEWPDVDYYKMRVDLNGTICHEIRIYNQSLFIKREEEVSFNSFPAIASHITAYARMYLWALIKKAGVENVVYCDTDSLFTNEQGLMRLSKYIDDKKLGFLKIEDEGYAEIRNVKDYTFNKTVKMKAIPKRAEFRDGTYWWWSFEKWRGSFKYGLHDGIILKLMHRAPKTPYEKRIVHEDGTTEPIRLYEEV